MKPRVVMWAFIATVFALHAACAWYAPLATDDWDMLMFQRAYRHAPTVRWFSELVSEHGTFADVVNILVAQYRFLHPIFTPLAGLATVFGIFTLASRRLPRFDAWDDVVDVIVIAALLWLAAPRLGLVYTHRPYAAKWLYGIAVALWFLAPFRCGWHPRGWRVVLVVLAGLLAGTATRSVGISCLVAVVITLRKTQERERWMWSGLAGVVVGSTIGMIVQPFDFKGWGVMLDFYVPFDEAIELVSLLLGLAVLKILLGVFWPSQRGDAMPDARESLGFMIAWFFYLPVMLCGPRYSQASVFGAAVILVIGAVPIVRWLMTSPPLRKLITVIALTTMAIAWSLALAANLRFGAEFRERYARIKAAPRNTVVTLAPYHQIRPTFFVYGEDLQDAARRELIAASLFRLRDIHLEPEFRLLERNPQLSIRLVTEGVTPQQLSDAGAPDEIATTLKTARRQFEDIVEALRERLTTPFSARLVIALDAEPLRGRELVGATYENGKLLTMRITRKPQDEESRQRIVVKPASFARRYSEAYAVIGGRTMPIKYSDGYRLQTLTTDLHAVIVCDPQRCFLVDAFIPAL